ncbi:MAG: SAM-dependent methyltransferase [Vampirovibrionales bacterium]|nr:SAM-dependent methyltransferase [Vampirovibrionales bacterium]
MNETLCAQQHAHSFRDPDGFIFTAGADLYRQINHSGKPAYDQLISSGLYQALIEDGSLISHEEIHASRALDAQSAYKVIAPQKIPFISYPYEWSFGQLQDAALLTLHLQKTALSHQMTLKDCSAYNVQFHRGRPVFIDTLSFEPYVEGTPWTPYRQFCQHFLAPLALMSFTDIRLSQLLRLYIDGVPLDLASKLLPFKTRFNFSLQTHIHFHASAQKKHETTSSAPSPKSGSGRVSRLALMGLIDNLESAARGLRWAPKGTEWGDYYENTNYSDAAFDAKKSAVDTFLTQLDAQTVWDMGANCGEFSRVASQRGIPVVSFDIDPAAVEKNYRQVKREGDPLILPLTMDLTNPSPAIGWANQERDALAQRGPTDTVLALALIHHLAISNNLPLKQIARFFASLCQKLIIEFVPKNDSQAQRLLSSRKDIFGEYDEPHFIEAFNQEFEIIASTPIAGSQRTLFAMRARAR